ncbi:MAG: VirB4 family type IV secretion system protein [Acidimicrobiales bacterium]
MKPPPPHRVTTAQLGAAYPFANEGGLGPGGVLIGRDLLGGAFAFDPFELYARGTLTNPNMIVLGQIGRGKSSFVKTFLWRQSVFGRQAWVVDPKGEYGGLASAWGVEPIRIAPGGDVRLNPLDNPHLGTDRVPGESSGRRGAPGDGSSEGTIPGLERQAGLLASLASACLGRDLLPRERVAGDLALAAVLNRHGGRATIPWVVEEMLEPSAHSARAINTSPASLTEDGRDMALEMRRLVAGDLRGMFDGPTSARIDLSAPLVVLDLSALYGSAALGILMACTLSWLQAALDLRTGAKRIVVVDEAWAILANLGVARWLQASWKLSRALGVANIAVLHRVSDLCSVGASGSEQVGLAQGLLADSETRVIYGQPPGEVGEARRLLGLTDTESALLPALGRGVGLWKVGTRSFVVEHRLSPFEYRLVDTDSGMLTTP